MKPLAYLCIVKKLLVIVLMMLYGFTSTGMSLQFHYCCGKLKNIDISLSTTSVHKKCGMEHKMGAEKCCQTKLVVSAQDDFYSFSEVKANPVFFICLLPVSYTYTSPLNILGEAPTPAIKAPPESSNPLFILHRVFRI